MNVDSVGVIELDGDTGSEIRRYSSHKTGCYGLAIKQEQSMIVSTNVHFPHPTSLLESTVLVLPAIII